MGAPAECRVVPPLPPPMLGSPPGGTPMRSARSPGTRSRLPGGPSCSFGARNTRLRWPLVADPCLAPPPFPGACHCRLPNCVGCPAACCRGHPPWPAFRAFTEAFTWSRTNGTIAFCRAVLIIGLRSSSLTRLPLALTCISLTKRPSAWPRIQSGLPSRTRMDVLKAARHSLFMASRSARMSWVSVPDSGSAKASVVRREARSAKN